MTDLPPVTTLPIVDASREGDPFTYPGRTVLDHLGYIEPLDERADTFIALPVRLCHTQGAGICLEVGPFTFNRLDIDKLRQAITAHDRALGG